MLFAGTSPWLAQDGSVFGVEGEAMLFVVGYWVRCGLGDVVVVKAVVERVVGGCASGWRGLLERRRNRTGLCEWLERVVREERCL